MARMKELCPIIQAGKRSMSQTEAFGINQESVFYAHSILNNNNWYSKVSDRIKENVYITIDLDVLDPSFMPSTGTPEPGGLSFNEVNNFVKYIIDNHNLVGFDVTELCPSKTNTSPDFIAAKLIYMILSYRFKS